MSNLRKTMERLSMEDKRKLVADEGENEEMAVEAEENEEMAVEAAVSEEDMEEAKANVEDYVKKPLTEAYNTLELICEHMNNDSLLIKDYLENNGSKIEEDIRDILGKIDSITSVLK